ncbi:MAG TPA: prolyl oligopeptidase family serine peptidase [Anaerolineales bacterium]|nr:prolyl oligopeptidase family serine peptidase [Anaerolineales bacterium]
MNPEEYLDALLNLPGIDDELWPQVSRDGKWVAWTWFHTGPAADVYAVPIDGSTPPIRLTETDQNTFLVSWTPDSKAVIVQQDNDGDERVQLFRIDLASPRTLKPLTEPKPNYYIRGGTLHPGENWLVYGANVHPGTSEETEETYIYRHDLTNGKCIPLAHQEKGGYTIPKLNAKGSHILYERNDLHPAGRQVWIVDIDGSNDRELFNFGEKRKTYAAWHPNGEQVLVLAETETHRRLGIWKLGDVDVRWLIDDPARDIQSAFVPEGCDEAVVVENIQGRVYCSLLNIDSKVETPVSAGEGNLIPLAPVSHTEWVGFYYSACQPGDIVRFMRAKTDVEEFVSLTRVWERTSLNPAQLAPAEDFYWKSVDGMSIHGWLYRASDDARGTIVYVHGGPTYHSPDFLNAQIQFFVSQGFNVLDPNYRGSTGYGLPFQQAILEDGWGGREQEDLRTGIKALIKSKVAQTGKIGMTGTSYGGYSSWWAITHFPTDIIAAAAPICGMTDLVVDYETTRPDIRPYSEEMIGGKPDEVPERYRERSPIHFVQNIKGKLLIIQGEQDPNVTPQNVDDVVKALNEHKVPFELLNFDDEGHGIYKGKNQRELYLCLVEFFNDAFSGD